MPNANRKPNRQSSDALWNLLSIFLVLATLAAAAVFLVIFIDPGNPINILRPPSLPERLVLPTTTQTPYIMPPTWTPTPTMTATATPVPPTDTATPQVYLPTGFSSDQIITPTPTSTAVSSSFPFIPMGNIIAVDAARFYSEKSCTWLGIEGQVFDLKNAPQFGLVVRLGGYLNNRSMRDMQAVTRDENGGQNPHYLIELPDSLTGSQGTLYVRLYDQGGIPLSEPIYFDTFEDCQRNLVLINFKQVR